MMKSVLKVMTSSFQMMIYLCATVPPRPPRHPRTGVRIDGAIYFSCVSAWVFHGFFMGFSCVFHAFSMRFSCVFVLEMTGLHLRWPFILTKWWFHFNHHVIYHMMILLFYENKVRLPLPGSRASSRPVANLDWRSRSFFVRFSVEISIEAPSKQTSQSSPQRDSRGCFLRERVSADGPPQQVRFQREESSFPIEESWFPNQEFSFPIEESWF